VTRLDFFCDNDDNEGTLEQLLEDHLGQEDFYSIKDSKFTNKTLTKLKEFIKEHDAIDLLEKRIAQGNMATFLQDNPGVFPPGMNSVTEYQISVRKPTYEE
jgi:tRNA U34 5-methylaminomethyl-2-thiouridine-forming methyltransferase MnmC